MTKKIFNSQDVYRNALPEQFNLLFSGVRFQEHIMDWPIISPIEKLWDVQERTLHFTIIESWILDRRNMLTLQNSDDPEKMQSKQSSNKY